MRYAELHVTTNYSFLRGASHVEELFAQAAVLGLPALGIVDRASLAGIARAHQRSAEAGVRLVVGCRLDLVDGTALLAYPTDRAAYSRLCRLLTLGKARTGKGGCRLDWDDLAAAAKGMLCVLLPDPKADAAPAMAQLRTILGNRSYVALTKRFVPGEAARLARLSAQAAAHRVAPVVTGDVLYHAPHRRPLQDVMTCIREGSRLQHAGLRLEPGTDRCLRPPAEMARLFRKFPHAIERTMEIVERCRFSLSELCYQYPDEVRVPGQTPQQALEALVWDCAPHRYPGGVPDAVTTQLRHELALIAELEYAPYFLTVHNIVAYARARGILCQGRGSAANSAVCWVIGITAIDPTSAGLLFERFVSNARREPPDIDVDFEHERREEVIQWVFDHYGRDRAALCATIVRYRARGAVREVGKAMGLSEDVTGLLASQVWGWSEEGVQAQHAAELNLDPADSRLAPTLALAQELIGFPRHMGTHPGGFVLTRDTLSDLVPIEPAAMVARQVIEWDKDDIDTLRFMKVDVLGLGMLGCLRRCFDLLAERHGIPMDMAAIPMEDSATFAMIQRADTLGTFQIESRAQMSMLPRLKPACLYDLTIQVAIVRPGPIQGDMVHPYLRRREGRETVSYPTEELRRVLGKTLGVPLFQEQAMQVAITCAGFTPTEADQLRRSMATFKMTGGVSHFREQLIAGMTARGYAAEFAARIFTQIEGFGSYGFPESHAASFALIAYTSAWVKCHYPDVFCAALLNAQPMGFYAPAQIVRDARAHGVEVRPVCINASRWDTSLEPTTGEWMAVRLGFRMVKGLSSAEAEAIVTARVTAPFRDTHDCWRRSGIGFAAVARIAEADGLASFGVSRRPALWTIVGLGEAPLPLFAAEDRPERIEPATPLPATTAGREVVEDYATLGLTLRPHPVSFLRDELARRGCVTCSALGDLRDGRMLEVAGLVLVRQRPGSAKGVLFVTIEDETGIANLIVWPNLFERQRRVVLGSGMIACRGRLQREGLVIHVVGQHLTDLSDLLRSVGERDGAFPQVHGRGDEATHGGAPDPRRVPRPRDIYCPEVETRGIRVETRDFR